MLHLLMSCVIVARTHVCPSLARTCFVVAFFFYVYYLCARRTIFACHGVMTGATGAQEGQQDPSHCHQCKLSPFLQRCKRLTRIGVSR